MRADSGAEAKVPLRPTLVVRNVLLSRQGEVLLGLRCDALKWELPGGKVEDETVAQAGVREQLEESGMDLLGHPMMLGFVDVLSEKGPGRRYVDLFLAWPRWDGFPRTAEGVHLAWRWFDLSSLPEADRLMASTAFFCQHLLPRFVQAAGPDEEEHEADVLPLEAP